MCFVEDVEKSVVIAGWHQALDQFDYALGGLFVVVSIVVVVINVLCRSGASQSVDVTGWHRALDQFDVFQRECLLYRSSKIRLTGDIVQATYNQLTSLCGIEHLTNLETIDVSDYRLQPFPFSLTIS